jgi:hypothetical protein
MTRHARRGITDTTKRQGINPALKILGFVVAGSLLLLCLSGLVLGWLFSTRLRREMTDSQRAGTRATLVLTSEIIRDIHTRDGVLLESLAELGWDDENPLVDSWGHRIVYEPSEDKRSFTVISYGADGAQGGEGENADEVVGVSLSER